MAGLTGYAVGVFVDGDLGEILRPCGTGAMASRAQHGSIEFGRCNGGIGGMRRERAVASFAIDLLVLSLVFLLRDIGVTGLAGLVAGKFGGMGCDLRDGRGAVVAVLPEGLRYDVSANGPENEECDDEQACKTKQMSRIFEEVHLDQVS